MKIPQLLVVGWTVLLGIKRAFSSTDPVQRRELRYRVPAGQDPAAALAALREHDLEAVVAMERGFEDVVIACDPTRDREHVRRVLEKASIDLGGENVQGPPIRFVDELSEA